MRSSLAFVASALSLANLALAAPFSGKVDKRSTVEKDGVRYNVFEHAATGAKLEFVNNSGICETTPGVNQYSGYLSVGTNMNMWFWLFEARENPTTAPLAAWFNGGPGCSSMIGLFQENGPCHFVDGSTEPSLNEYSWNSYANMIYIDQPIGVGFSYGNDEVVDSTETAAPYVWKLIQAFYDAFPQYESRDFGIFTESYGGHYGPEFAHYIQDQNKGIASGSVDGQKINLIALGVNNGWIDAELQEKAYIDYSLNNTYKKIISQSEATSYYNAYTKTCLPAIQSCESTGTVSACVNADNKCYNSIEGPLSEEADFNVYDVRIGASVTDPPETYADYLARDDVKKAIGARSTYSECADTPYNKFSSTGDNPRSFLPELNSVVQSGLTTLVWAGDADWICNWMGNYDAAQAVEFDGQTEFRAASLEPYKVNGVEGGTFKTVDNFSFLRVYEAGHEVPYYQPELALQVFKQTMQKKPISST
ncbi:Carboxypeptidase S1 [Lasiodiplodia hormozganensis]|uniref:Carboxypeptidase n=2 Tax=Lasiodiplodia TaxID=66739 RepID=A0A5N5DT46_9PEZI|nr:Carboxypeptidase s1 [Lasiodiplodia theobromae]KAB2581155.1 Carboxypeptidase S1 [Lasiodiplodia theobromae]KAF4543864.1 Carboxypeptidase s1 [Lasiodiplodia theobromae]KAK0664384.1 Carboxypeptidase S1 [Lasiodiplodia hormozganensis]